MLMTSRIACRWAYMTAFFWELEPNQTAHLAAFNAMRDALNATGKTMVHSIHWNYGDTPGPGCARGVDCPLPAVANMWRVGNDIRPQWDSVLKLIDTDAGHASAAGPGQWNDADMLPIGVTFTMNGDGKKVPVTAFTTNAFRR